MGRLDGGAVIAAIFLMAFGGALAGTQVHFIRKRSETDRTSSFGMWLVLIIYGVGSSLIALTLLRYAVGIR